MAGRSLAGPRCGPRRAQRAQLSDAHAADVRELPARAPHRSHTADGSAGRGRAGGAPDPPAGTAADLPGCVWVSGICAHGRASRARSVYAHCRRSAHRSGLPVRRLALPALSLRPAVHARELRDGAAGPRGRPVGVQGARRGFEPRRGGPDRADGRRTRSVGALGGRFRGPEPRAAGARRRWRAQRHADLAGAGGGSGSGHRSQPAPAGGGRRVGGRRGGQAHRGPRGAVPGARAGPYA